MQAEGQDPLILIGGRSVMSPGEKFRLAAWVYFAYGIVYMAGAMLRSSPCSTPVEISCPSHQVMVLKTNRTSKTVNVHSLAWICLRFGR